MESKDSRVARKVRTKAATSHPTHPPSFSIWSPVRCGDGSCLFQDSGILTPRFSPPTVDGSHDPHKPLGTEDRTLSCSTGFGDQHPDPHVLSLATHNLLCSLKGRKESVLEPESQDVFFSHTLHALTDPTQAQSSALGRQRFKCSSDEGLTGAA